MGVRPDLSAWSKAIANGYPLAFVAGVDALRDAARSVYSTGSFWCGSASMAAALATLDVLDAGDAVNHLARMGDRLRAGLARQAASHGVGIRQTGPSQMPQVLFDDDADFAKGFRFTSEALRRGVYLHPEAQHVPLARPYRGRYRSRARGDRGGDADGGEGLSLRRCGKTP